MPDDIHTLIARWETIAKQPLAPKMIPVPTADLLRLIEELKDLYRRLAITWEADAENQEND